MHQSVGWVILMAAVLLGAAGVTRWRTSRSVPYSKPSRIGLLVPGIVLGAGSLIGFAAPFVFLALGRYGDALITLAAPIISLYFGFIAYVLIWDATFGTRPPYAKTIGAWFARQVHRPSA
jgi:hypothetical protein